jgi:putative flippase GtrA
MSIDLNAAQLTKFLVAGGIAAAANIGSRMGFSTVLPFSVAVVLAYVVGLLSAFVLFRLFVFPQTTGNESTLGQLWRFTLINLVALPQTFLVSMFLLYLMNHLGVGRSAETIAHSVGVMVPIITSFLGHKYFSFASRRT